MKKQPECKISSNGTKRWYLNDKLHRTDGPAIECVDGRKHWYLKGERHRTDGPACEYLDGLKYWFLNGKQVNPKVLVEKGYMTEEELMLELI